MDKPRSAQKANERFLAMALTLVFLLVNAVNSTPPVHAFFIGPPVSVMINSASYGTFGSYNVVKANLTSAWPYSQLSLVVFAVWKNIDGQTVAITTGSLTLGPNATGTTFAPLLPGALVSGYYIVDVFAVTTSNNPVTSVTTFSVII